VSVKQYSEFKCKYAILGFLFLHVVKRHLLGKMAKNKVLID